MKKYKYIYAVDRFIYLTFQSSSGLRLTLLFFIDLPRDFMGWTFHLEAFFFVMKNPWPRWPTQLFAIMDYDPFHLSLSLHLHFKCIISEPSKMHKKHVHTQGTVWNHTKPPKTMFKPCRKRAHAHVHWTYNYI